MPDEAIAAVLRLKEHPAEYRAMVDHGTPAADYTNQRVAERWHRAIRSGGDSLPVLADDASGPS